MDYSFGNTPGVVKSTYGSQGRSEQFGVPIAKKVVKGPEYNLWYWSPSNVAAQFAPDWFRKQVKAIEADIEVTWSPIAERWLIWIRDPKVQNKLCQGWRLLFVHHDEDRQYLPLDERVMARLYLIDATRNGGSRAYFARIMAEYERDEAKKRENLRQDAIDRAMPYFEYSQIKNIGTGSKFSDYFA